ncbi:inositol monophosphatase family protein [Pelotomaculum propionicicum]|uniref:Inositol-1-monophosphatase n=1 Tax=Pelotomaculum propionicicum TaxID=258475 RepID=A0A4Y7RTP9_9FIRM|nr:inositol monophosphatase family protein [Pelotomaculum propionicicum]NLI14142.1 inositol monophosphatase [Peptococcaceae bacterium]TEB12355.1 Inositol-1-monophosphatase [Pelotomaculum propionicicum]
MEYAVYLETAAVLARQAGKIIKDKFGGQFEKGYKSCPSDLVTEVDRASEALIINILRQKFPGHGIIGEESSGNAAIAQGGYAWCIDPLDGTTNFVYGIPFCSVSIGLIHNGEAVAGVVYDPLRDECFSAALGCGSFLNGGPIRVDATRKKLSEALLVTGYPENKSYSGLLRRVDYHKMAHSCSNLRALGSAALELAYIACGRLTGFWENPLMPWDVAAGSVLVREAGGKVTDIEGGKLRLERYLSITASNGLIHEELLQALL